MRPIQPVSVAGLEFDALLNGGEQYAADVPSYPVDSGFSVADNASLTPMQLAMTLYVTATPVTWLNRHGVDFNRVHRVCDELVSIFENREPITVSTQDKTYSNMVITNITIKKAQEEGYAREIQVAFTQIIVTSASAAEVPAGYSRSGESMANAGAAVTNNVPAGTVENAAESNTAAKQSANGNDDPGKTVMAGFVDVIGAGYHSVKNTVESALSPYMSGDSRSKKGSK